MKSTDYLAYSIVFILWVTIFLFGSCKVKPFNYSRANLWQSLTLAFILIEQSISILLYHLNIGYKVYYLQFFLTGITVALFGIFY